jgi:integrase
MFDVIKTEEFDHRIPIHPRLRDRLEEIATDDPNPKAFLMPSLAGKESRGAHGLSAGFMAVMHRAGVDPGEMQSGLRKMSRRSFHSLRHTAASTLLDAGVDTELVRAITGHADGKSFRRYLHPSDEALTQAVSKMRK